VCFLPFHAFVLVAAILELSLASGNAADEKEVTGREAEAIALAVNTFQAEHRKEPKFYGDLKHYTVSIERQGRQVDVVFIPDRSPKPRNVPEPYLELGGSTVYGSEVHYIISLDRMKILKEHYAR
jgi:hypothetical protein